jgi:nucleoside-diphosphate-sugar epimerase
MRILVTGSSGHLGEALVSTLRADGHDTVGLDLLPSPATDFVGSIGDQSTVRRALHGVRAVLHTATLHQPHARSATRQAYVDTNVTGTLVLLEQALAQGVDRFVFTSTTSTFGLALIPGEGAPAAWITEDTVPLPRNIYGVTKVAAENVCELIHRDSGLPIVILRTSRFFPEPDDDPEINAYGLGNVQANEMLYRRVDLADVVQAHRCALDRVPEIGFGRYIVSATTPFTRADLASLRSSAPAVVRRLYPDFDSRYAERGWRMFPGINRVYDNARARAELRWDPEYDFARLLRSLANGEDPRSPLAVAVGSKGYR